MTAVDDLQSRCADISTLCFSFCLLNVTTLENKGPIKTQALVWFIQVDQRVFKDLMSEKLPRLHAHFEQHKVDFSLITFNWFLVVFVDSVVSDILFKIWDAFLFEGPKVRGLILLS